MKVTETFICRFQFTSFYNTLMGDIRSLKALNIDVSACAPMIVPIVEEKLPGKILSSLCDCGTDVDFKLDDFTENYKTTFYVKSKHILLMPREYKMHSHPLVMTCINPSSTLSTMVASTNNCPQRCNESHTTQRCPLSAFEKQNIVLTNKLRLNCLRSGHRVSQWNARGRCAKCKDKHHTAIHGIQIHPSTNHTPQRHKHSCTLGTVKSTCCHSFNRTVITSSQ